MNDNPFILKEIKRIAFFGDSEVKPGNEVYEEAYRGARLVARKGYVVVNGGGPGVMEAATSGAESVGGETLIITFNPTDAPGFEGLDSNNKADNVIEYDNYPDRLKGLLENADVYLIFKGGTGTLSELGMVWVLAKIYYGKHKPFILVGDFWKPIMEAVQEKLLLDDIEMGLFKIVDTVDEALSIIEEWKKKLENGK